MIDRQEIFELALEFSLRPDIVEKDYALGWLLAGIGNHEAANKSWVFKGGTCLKKCYFETYRFSEDLDFTLIESSQLDEDFLNRTFREISDWVYEQSGLELPPDRIRFEVYRNPRGNVSVEGKVSYRGPIAPRGDLPRIKLDLTADERVSQRPVKRNVHHGYLDAPPEGMQIVCYSYEEIFAEKIRALGERLMPRDLYDVIHLYRNQGMSPDRESVLNILKEKCDFKSIPVPSWATLEHEPRRAELELEWSNMLSHQLPSLPPFELFWSELRNVFMWLEEKVEPKVLVRVSAGADEDTQWAPSSYAQRWDFRVPLEVIRFAGVNRLCVNLGYDGTKRIIEPYSLRRTKAGNIILHALHADDKAHRSYRADRIESAEITPHSFNPTYAVELTPAGALHVLPVQY